MNILEFFIVGESQHLWYFYTDTASVTPHQDIVSRKLALPSSKTSSSSGNEDNGPQVSRSADTDITLPSRKDSISPLRSNFFATQRTFSSLDSKEFIAD